MSTTMDDPYRTLLAKDDDPPPLPPPPPPPDADVQQPPVTLREWVQPGRLGHNLRHFTFKLLPELVHRGIYPLPFRIVVVLFATTVAQYLSSSVLGLALYTQLDFSPQQNTLFYTYESWVYWFSPVVGWLADQFVVFQHRRRPAMLLGALINIVTWSVLFVACIPKKDAAFGDNVITLTYAGFVGIALTATFGQMLLSVPLNGMVVELAVAEEERQLLEKQWRDANSSPPQRGAPSPVGAANCETLFVEDTDLDGGDGIEKLSDHSSNSSNNVSAKDAEERHEGPNRTTTAGLTPSSGRDLSDLTLGKIQSRALLWRTTGSLFAASLQTALQVRFTSIQLLVLAPALYLLVIPLILALRYTPKTTAQQRYLGMSLKERLLGAMETFREDVLRMCKASQTTATTAAARGQLVAQWPLFGVCSVVLFVFVYNLMPDASTMYSQWLYDEYFFPEWFLSLTSSTGLMGSCLGCEIYSRCIAKHNQMRVFAIGCVMSFLCFGTRLALVTGFATETLKFNLEAFVLIDGFVVAVLSRIAFIPVIQVAAERAPLGFEAFVFELFSTASIGGSTVASMMVVQLSEDMGITSSNWSNFWKLMVLCAASKLLPLLLLPLLPARPTPQPRTGGDAGSSVDYSGSENNSLQTMDEVV